MMAPTIRRNIEPTPAYLPGYEYLEFQKQPIRNKSLVLCEEREKLEFLKSVYMRKGCMRNYKKAFFKK